ncbi:hypothetical protein [Synechococcus sp. BIOS-E4-1]|uniref:hypothetical protein n=1 Tax=Synechococcus sp. BIOS-E4-1 TaxID=1400864 RepID=UPI001647B2EF|nr:hypothetical protein [Synechococcus sp. BIOS-E4-1]
MDPQQRAAKEQGILGQIKRGLSEGFRVTPEDRRDLLWEIRDAEGKSEPPRGTQVFGTQPLFDAARQAKTVDPQQFGWLPVDAINNESFIRRANAGLNFGPSPMDLIGEQVTETNLPRYKEALHNQGFARKAAYLGGTVASDIVNDGARSIWWLLNAPQATTNVINEQLGATLNPDLFANRVVPLEEAQKKGWVAYVEPQLDPEVFQARVKKIRDARSGEVFNAMADSQLDMDNIEEALDAFDQGVETEARRELLEEAKKEPVNYKRTRPGVKIRSNRIYKRRFNPNLVTAATLIPAGVAINSGIGLLGRQEGYAVTVPQEDDPFSTDNVVAEVAARYLTGREGRLLEAEDFLLERPDVSYGEYQKYKGYLRDRDVDLNPFDDGRINLGGILKTNPDGIRGAEVSFMGKTLPVNDTLLGTGGAILGAAGGAALTNLGSIRFRGGMRGRKGLGKLGAFVPEVMPRQSDGTRIQAHPNNKFINNMQAEFDKDDGWQHNARVLGTVFGGGMLGLTAGEVTGNAIEDERRRRNFEERNPGIDYETYRANAKQLLKDKYDLMKANPSAAEEREKSRTGFSKRSQQQALNTKALQQQTLVDQIVDQDLRQQADKAMSTQQWALGKSQAIDEEIGRRRARKQEEEQPMTIPF